MHNYTIFLAILGLAACAGDDKEDTGTGAAPDDTEETMPGDTDDTGGTMPVEVDGYVYAMTNGAAGNEVVAFRATDAGLEFSSARTAPR